MMWRVMVGDSFKELKHVGIIWADDEASALHTAKDMWRDHKYIVVSPSSRNGSPATTIDQRVSYLQYLVSIDTSESPLRFGDRLVWAGK